MSHYTQDHLIGKVIIALIISGMLYLDGQSAIAIACVWVWLFGINPVSYFVEAVRKHTHNHKIL